MRVPLVLTDFNGRAAWWIRRVWQDVAEFRIAKGTEQASSTAAGLGWSETICPNVPSEAEDLQAWSCQVLKAIQAGREGYTHDLAADDEAIGIK